MVRAVGIWDDDDDDDDGKDDEDGAKDCGPTCLKIIAKYYFLILCEKPCDLGFLC